MMEFDGYVHRSSCETIEKDAWHFEKQIDGQSVLESRASVSNQRYTAYYCTNDLSNLIQAASFLFSMDLIYFSLKPKPKLVGSFSLV